MDNFQDIPSPSSYYFHITLIFYFALLLYHVYNLFKSNNTSVVGGAGQNEIHTEAAATVHPLLVPEIVEVLMDNLDDKTILKARTVCKLWDSEAIKSIRKKIQASQFKSRPLNMTFPLFPKQILENNKWASVFGNSKVRDILFSNLSILVADLEYIFRPSSTLDSLWQFFTASDSELAVLKAYGLYAKELIILPSLNNTIFSTNLDLGNLARLLTEFCPNFERLWTGDPIRKKPIADVDAFHFAKSQKLKLKNLRYWIANGHIDDTVTQGNFQLLKRLLNHSPGLNSISVHFHITALWNMFFTELSTKPEITLNLREISLTGNILDVLHLLNGTKFGSNLKKVTLHHSVQRPHLPDDILRQLQHFIWTIGSNLSVLEFEQSKEYGRQEVDFEGEPILILEENEVNNVFPELPLLKKFTSYFKFKSFKFIEKMLNLTELSLIRMTNKEEILEQAQYCPNNKIEQLTLDKSSKSDYSWDENFVFHGIYSSDIIQKINLGFPNLTEFYLELIPPTVFTDYGLSLWFQQVCQQISLMQNLKKLKMLVFPSDYFGKDPWVWFTQVDLERGFEFLKATLNLESLILAHALIFSIGMIENDGSDVPFPRTPLLKLLEAPRLTRLKLSGLKVDAVNPLDEMEIAEVEEFLELFSSSQVQLSIVKNNSLKWMRED